MGKEVFKGLIGAVTGGGAKPKKADTAPIEDVNEASRKAAASRSRLLETDGGASGEELNPDEVQKRKTLLGN